MLKWKGIFGKVKCGMAKITLLCVGKLKEKYWSQACAEYEKRLRRYCELTIVESKESVTDDPVEEGKLLLKKISSRAYVIACDVDGQSLDSAAWAGLLQKIIEEYGKEIVFVVGGSNGLSADVKKRADLRISFSEMTFPHQLFRVVLLEQIYRAFTIMNNEKYHKGAKKRTS